jgi:hypothetical protein
MKNLPQPEFDRNEVMACMVVAFAVAGGSVSIIYRLVG